MTTYSWEFKSNEILAEVLKMQKLHARNWLYIKGLNLRIIIEAYNLWNDPKRRNSCCCQLKLNN